MVGTQITRFLIKTNHKISHLKGLQKTAPNRLGAQTSTYCTRTLRLRPTTFLFMWLRNKICFADVVSTQITRFSVRMNHKLSHLKGLQRTTPCGLGAQTSTCSVLEHCVYLLPSLVAHHHLTKVILIGIICISQILQ